MLLKYLPSQYNGTDYSGRNVYNLDFGGDGGGGGSAPAQPTQISQLTIPEYAQPYMETLLGKTQALTSSPYQTYGGQRIAGSTPEQQAIRSEVAGMSLPGQYAAGTQLLGTGGQQSLGYGGMGAELGGGALGTGMQALGYGGAGAGYGAMGAGLGALASGAGQNYFGLATSPEAQQAFMSPYMQNVVDVQKQEAIRDAQKQQLMQNLGAARQGTYGGARQLLAGTERERNLGEQLAQIQATGSQRAFEAAQQAQQFGSDLGLRGYQAGMQGAGLGIEGARAGMQGVGQALQGYQTGLQGLGLGLQGAQQAAQAGVGLGQIGTAQQQSALDLAKAKEAFGAMGQQEQQRLMDLQYQDFINQQQYPYKQLGFMSDILRGSANLAGTGGKTIYEAPPSMLSQVGGLGLAGLGMYNLLK